MDLSEIDFHYRSDIEMAIIYLKSVGCKEIYLFGSVNTGFVHGNSDIDLAVRGIKPEDFFSIYGELMFMLEHNVDLIDLDLQEEFGKDLIRTENLRRVA